MSNNRETTCRHYSYVRATFPRNTKTLEDSEGPQCAKGHALRGVGCVKPCVYPQHGDLCKDRESYSDEEVKDRDSEIEASISRVGKIFAAIPNEGWEGDIPCPCCASGRVRWSRARVNRHIHASCSTPGCVSFMQ